MSKKIITGKKNARQFYKGVKNVKPINGSNRPIVRGGIAL